MPETYDDEAVQQILRLAIVKQGQDRPLPRSQLLEIAEELGIPESVLVKAEEEWQIQQEEQQARGDFEVYRHQQLRRGITRFLVVNSFLVLLNLLTSHTINWSVYPVLIWGLAIALQSWQTFQAEGEEYDRSFRRWRLRQQIGQSFKAISERLKIVDPIDSTTEAGDRFSNASVTRTSTQSTSDNLSSTPLSTGSPSSVSDSLSSQFASPLGEPTALTLDPGDPASTQDSPMDALAVNSSDNESSSSLTTNGRSKGQNDTPSNTHHQHQLTQDEPSTDQVRPSNRPLNGSP